MRRFAIAGVAAVAVLLASAASAAASGWSIQNTPNRKGAGNILKSVSCASTRACTAVGEYEIGMSTQGTLALRWNGTKWSIQQTPNRTGAPYSVLNGVSCASTSACTAVGYYNNGKSKQAALAERWNGTKWSIQQTPNPTGGSEISLNGVSCASTGACTAVGEYYNGTATVPLAERWNGTKWSIQRTPDPTGASRSVLNGVSCASARVCTAAGDYDGLPLVEHWTGTKWSIQQTPSPAGGSDIYFSAVSCAAAGACTAVGQYFNGVSATVTLAERWNGTKWSIQQTPNPTGSFDSEPNGVSCASARFCTAVGTYNNGSAAFVERWNGTKWSIQQTPNPTGAMGTGLSSVWCASTSACTAVGDYVNAKGTTLRTLAERWKRGV